MAGAFRGQGSLLPLSSRLTLARAYLLILTGGDNSLASLCSGGRVDDVIRIVRLTGAWLRGRLTRAKLHCCVLVTEQEIITASKVVVEVMDSGARAHGCAHREAGEVLSSDFGGARAPPGVPSPQGGPGRELRPRRPGTGLGCQEGAQGGWWPGRRHLRGCVLPTGPSPLGVARSNLVVSPPTH